MPAKVLEACNCSGQCKDQRTAEAILAAHDHVCPGARNPIADLLANCRQQSQKADQPSKFEANPGHVRFSGRKRCVQVRIYVNHQLLGLPSQNSIVILLAAQGLCSS